MTYLLPSFRIKIGDRRYDGALLFVRQFRKDRQGKNLQPRRFGLPENFPACVPGRQTLCVDAMASDNIDFGRYAPAVQMLAQCIAVSHANR